MRDYRVPSLPRELSFSTSLLSCAWWPSCLCTPLPLWILLHISCTLILIHNKQWKQLWLHFLEPIRLICLSLSCARSSSILGRFIGITLSWLSIELAVLVNAARSGLRSNFSWSMVPIDIADVGTTSCYTDARWNNLKRTYRGWRHNLKITRKIFLFFLFRKIKRTI